MKIKFYTLLILFSIIAISAKAQNYFGVNAQVTLPQNEFKQKGFAIGGGIGLQYLTKNLLPSSTLFQTRFNYQLDILTSESMRTRDVLIPTHNNNWGDAYYGNSSAGLSVGPQFSINIGKRLQPYVTFFGTARVFNSYKSYHFRNFYYYDDNNFTPVNGPSRSIYTALRFQYGYGGGFMYKIADKVHLDVRISYANGGGTSFIKLNSVRKTPDGETEYSTEKSLTSEAINTYIGIIFAL